jgi:hypothetical protein
VARYAADTNVPIDRSRAEIEHMLERHGATAFGYLSDGDAQVIVFQIGGRRVLMHLPLPDRDDSEFTLTPGRRLRRSPAEARRAYEQAVRSRWRALVLVIKAKLEAVAAGISTVEREFLADLALPNGQTVEQYLAPQLEQVYAAGEMPALLPRRGDG